MMCISWIILHTHYSFLYGGSMVLHMWHNSRLIEPGIISEKPVLEIRYRQSNGHLKILWLFVASYFLYSIKMHFLTILFFYGADRVADLKNILFSWGIGLNVHLLLFRNNYLIILILLVLLLNNNTWDNLIFICRLV